MGLSLAYDLGLEEGRFLLGAGCGVQILRSCRKSIDLYCTIFQAFSRFICVSYLNIERDMAEGDLFSYTAHAWQTGTIRNWNSRTINHLYLQSLPIPESMIYI